MTSKIDKKPLIGIVMGSSSDWDVMSNACKILEQFGIPFEAKVVSAHRMPDEMFAYAETARSRGLKAIIAGAGGAAHLPGMLAAKTTLPVLGVPCVSKYLRGQDSLYSIVQMPKGVPVATFAIGEAGAANAAIYAVRMLSMTDDTLAEKLEQFRASQNQAARDMVLPRPADEKHESASARLLAWNDGRRSARPYVQFGRLAPRVSRSGSGSG